MSIYYPIKAPNWTYYSGNPNILDAEIQDSKKNLFSSLLSRFGTGKYLLNKDKFPNLSLSGANNMLRNIGKTSITEGGPTLGNIGLGLYGGKQALDLINEGSNLAGSYTDLDDLKRNVKMSAYSNPLVNDYLSTEDQNLLRQVRNGSFDAQNPVGAASGGVVSNLPSTLKNAFLGYLLSGGNPLGAIIGGGSSLVKGGLQGVSKTNQEKASRLQELYSRLQEAEADYRTMKRPSGLKTAGLSSRAYAGLY